MNFIPYFAHGPDTEIQIRSTQEIKYGNFYLIVVSFGDGIYNFYFFTGLELLCDAEIVDEKISGGGAYFNCREFSASGKIDRI